MDIYVKPLKKADLYQRGSVRLGDIAELYAPDEILRRLKKIKLLDIDAAKKGSFLITATDIIRAIDAELPGNTITNAGEIETLVEYKPKKGGQNKVYMFIKVFLISVVIFVGASTAIMSFHNDADMPKVFKTYYRILFGEENENPLIIYIPYSLGLAAGIIVFFNHFLGKKLTSDPTPIEVKISVYEADVTDTKLEALNQARRKAGEDK